MLLIILYVHLQTLKYINCIINCNTVPYSYFLHVLLQHILYIELQTLKFINCIIRCNIAQYSYFPNLMLVHSISIHWNNLKYINCIINCNIVPYPFSFLNETFSMYTKFPHSVPIHNINYSLLCRTNEHNLVLHSYNVHLSACDWIPCSVYRMCCVCLVAVGVKEWNV